MTTFEETLRIPNIAETKRLYKKLNIPLSSAVGGHVDKHGQDRHGTGKIGFGHYVQFYTWEEPEYRDFMMKILTNLAPRHANMGDILFDEN